MPIIDGEHQFIFYATGKSVVLVLECWVYDLPLNFAYVEIISKSPLQNS